MKLRRDLLEHLTAEDIARAAEANVYRFKPEPLFSQTGTGGRSSASTRGVIVKVLADGRVKWRTETGAGSIAAPETLTID